MVEYKELIRDYFKQVKFTEEGHLYHHNNKRIGTSVSSLCKAYKKPFDAMMISGFVAKKRGITSAQVRQEWKSAGDRATSEGTFVHSILEDYVNSDFKTFGPVIGKALAGKEFLDGLGKRGLRVVDTEIVVYCKELDAAGQVDLLLYDKSDGKFIIADYKTNKDLKKSYGYLLEPFEYLRDSSENYYSIQLSFYQYFLEQIPELKGKVKDRWIIHLTAEGYKIIPVEYRIKS